jgi:hypothetical protein
MFEITPQDIAALNDTDLRTLVHRLAESYVESRGFSSSHVMAGGAQDAPDEGVDVHVGLPPDAQIDGFVPRAATVFQVKNMDLPPARIRKEMRLSDSVVRPVIQDLANQGGAYIIATSGSVTYPMQKARLAAMRDAAKDVANRDALLLDYYDQTRLASWVRRSRAVIPWIREKIDKAIPGWRAYGAWAYPAEGADAEYLVDDHLRVLTGEKNYADGLGAVAGIEHTRALLNVPGKVVRLVGLSGVGKTRFTQALFDSRVGQHGLDPSLAIYTNLPDNPDPHPRNLATDFVNAGDRGILVIDNCTSELHRRLSEVCRAPGSKLSLITLEHDVRDDTPEGTDVFRLEPSSVGLIEKLVARRFPEVSPVSVRTIAENSDGNARIAIALAGTVGKNETISALPDEEQFRRLFQQGNAEDGSLLLAAQAMSLVYSFQGENVSDDKDAELVRLGSIVGKTALEMYRHAATLHDRGLVQHRGVWRALLPQALANRLAKSALKCIPPGTIDAHLVQGAPARLLKSFSRRLGYLSDSAEAILTARKWLAPDGLLANVANFNDLGRAMFENVAPVAPEAALSALERVLLGPDGDAALPGCKHFPRLLRLLAYDAAVFERCAALLQKIAVVEDVEDKSQGARSIFVSLFSLYLSGTHATVEQRLAAIKPLLLSDDPNEQSLGLKALGAMLQATHFGSTYGFEFGSRVRDYGFWPKTVGDVKHWFGAVLQFAADIGSSNAASANAVRKVMADHFRGLWTLADVYDELEAASAAIATKHFWQYGWIAVRETQCYDSPGFPPVVASRLSSLEQLLRPKDIVQKVLAIVLGDESYSYDVVDLEVEDGGEDGDTDTKAIGKRFDATNALARSLGQAVVGDAGVFETLIGKLLVGRGLLWMFGRGLAEGSQDLASTWDRLRQQVAATPAEKFNTQLLRGFLEAVHNLEPELANDVLETAVDDEVFAYWYPAMEAAIDIDESGAKRLMRALSTGRAPIQMYGTMIYGGVTKGIPPQAFANLVMAIAEKPNGSGVATEILGMRLHGEKGEVPEEIREASWTLLNAHSFTGKDHHEGYRLAQIAYACLRGDKATVRVTELCRKLKRAIREHHTHFVYYDDFLGALLSVEPKAALDAISGEEDIESGQGLHLLEDVFRNRRQHFGAIPEASLLAWCDEKPARRYPALASVVVISTNDGGSGPYEWSRLALRLLEKAPDRIEVLKRFVAQIKSSGGWGSRTAIIEAKAKLLDKLEQYPDSAVVAFVGDEKVRLAQFIDHEKRAEATRDRAEGDRFE